MNPVVSVLISTYNRAQLLPRAIDSVLSQEFQDFELVIIDDASSDATPEVLDGYRDDSRFKILRNENNLGLQKSLNVAIAASSGEYLARIDDDDCWSDLSKLGLQVEKMTAQANLGLIGTAYIDEWGKQASNPLADTDIRDQMLFRCPFCHSSVLMRKAALDDVGNYDESLPYAEDWDLWMRIGKHWQLANLPGIMVTREQGADTLSEQYFLQQLEIAQSLGKSHGAGYPKRRMAACYHGFSRLFFRVFPMGGRMHRFMGGLFRRTFGLQGA